MKGLLSKKGVMVIPPTFDVHGLPFGERINNVIKNVPCNCFADTAVESARDIFAFNLPSEKSKTLQAPLRNNIHNGHQISAL